VPGLVRERIMNAAQLQKVIAKYRDKFKELGIEKIDYPHAILLDSQKHGLEHCHGMLDQMEVFIDQGRLEKVFRWLGFIQCMLWSARVYVMNDLKDHNRSEE
jgi:hypothetical protein